MDRTDKSMILIFIIGFIFIAYGVSLKTRYSSIVTSPKPYNEDANGVETVDVTQELKKRVAIKMKIAEQQKPIIIEWIFVGGEWIHIRPLDVDKVLDDNGKLLGDCDYEEVR